MATVYQSIMSGSVSCAHSIFSILLIHAMISKLWPWFSNMAVLKNYFCTAAVMVLQ